MYATMVTASTHITSDGCYFEAHPRIPFRSNLRPSIEEVVSFPKSYGLTLLVINLLGDGPAAAMVDVCYQKRGILYKKGPLETAFPEMHSSFVFQALGWLNVRYCRARSELS